MLDQTVTSDLVFGGTLEREVFDFGNFFRVAFTEDRPDEGPLGMPVPVGSDPLVRDLGAFEMGFVAAGV